MKDQRAIHPYLEKIFDAAAVSILWIICCIPIVTIGASTTALYYTVNKVIKKDRGYITEEFFKSFRQNLKPSTVLWVVLGVITVVLQLNIGIVRKTFDNDFGIFLLMFYGFCLVIVWGIQMYVFPALSRFDMPAGWILKLSIYLCFRHFWRTAVMLFITLVSIGLIYCFLPLLLILPFLSNYLFHLLIEPVLKRHMPLQNRLG